MIARAVRIGALGAIAPAILFLRYALGAPWWLAAGVGAGVGVALVVLFVQADRRNGAP